MKNFILFLIAMLLLIAGLVYVTRTIVETVTPVLDSIKNRTETMHERLEK